ncbi:sterile alpha motif domain-containing protein 7 [Hoplias malabaricus]|uniref:sterile alpha motif domain-containing protein 7 n=1 Tax=Hoplias malabaricus TaxID=27720 RepID=UPI00346196A5
MTPREQLRKMSALGDQSALDEKHWYRLVNGMSAGELRQRQELMMRNQMAMTPQMQQRLQTVPTQFEPRFIDRELVPPAEMVSSEARQMHMGAHLGAPLPSHSNIIPSRGFPTAAGGYGFLPTESMETVARRQELLHKQNIARMEMNAILHQKELESAHQKGLMGIETPMMYQGLPPNPMAFRGRQRLPEGHDVFVQRPTLEDLQTNSLLLSSSPYPPISSLQRERGRRPGRRATNHNHKGSEVTAAGPKIATEEKSVEQSPGGVSGEEKEPEPKGDISTDATTCQSKPLQVKLDTDVSTSVSRKSFKDGEGILRKPCLGPQDVAEGSGCNSGGEKDMSTPCSAFQDKFLYPPAAPLSGFPYVFPVPGNGLLPPGPPVFLNGEDMPAVEDLRKWTVEDVYNFVHEVPSCSEYAQTFKDHMIDGETLPLLTEEHLLDTLGLKLGPALKIRSQISRKLGSMLCLLNMPLAPGLQGEKSADRSSEVESPLHCHSVELLNSPREADGQKSTEQGPDIEGQSPAANNETA